MASSVGSRGSRASEKRIYFIRHGQSESNILFYKGKISQARAILDPGLSDTGFAQAEKASRDPILGEALQSESPVLVVISPLRRTIQTAMGILGDWLEEVGKIAARKPRVVFEPDIQETGEAPCDQGRPPEQVREEFEKKYPFLPFLLKRSI